MISSIDVGGYDIDAFHRGTDPVLRIFYSAEQARRLAQYQGDPQLRQEIDELAAKSNEGTLTPAEKAKYEGYVSANKFVAILQAQARKFLADQPSE